MSGINFRHKWNPELISMEEHSAWPSSILNCFCHLLELSHVTVQSSYFLFMAPSSMIKKRRKQTNYCVIRHMHSFYFTGEEEGRKYSQKACVPGRYQYKKILCYQGHTHFFFMGKEGINSAKKQLNIWNLL